MLFGTNSIDGAVVGLGNPGTEYEMTRHNAGFRAVDYISGACGCKVDRLRHMGLTGKCRIGDHNVLLVKPQTYMNSSGECVADISRFYKLDPSRIIVVCDDITLLAGSVRIRSKGSAGGHNGLKSIIERLGTDAFPRIRLGVGTEGQHEELVGFVLGAMKGSDDDAMTASFGSVLGAVSLLLDGKTDEAMSRYNVTVRHCE